MTDDGASLALTLAPARPDQRELLWRLLQLYLHDFSAFASADDPHGVIGEDGAFDDPGFADYWGGDPRRSVVLFRVAGDPAGFALVNDWAPSGRPVDRALAEFFVLAKYRRAGIGGRAARTLFAGAPGLWELGVTDYNAPALAFWRRVLAVGTSSETAPLVDLAEIQAANARWNGTIFRFRST